MINLFRKKPIIRNLRDYLNKLREEKELIEINCEVDPNLELSEIHRRVSSQGGPAILFKNVKGSKFPVATNLFGTEKRLELAFPDRPEKFIEELVKLATSEMPPKLSKLWNKREHMKRFLNLGLRKEKNAKVLECKTHDLEEIPFTFCWPKDGGSFLTLPLVYTEPSGKHGAPNLGMYRIQRFSKTVTGLHFQIGKGGGFHYLEAERENSPLPVSIFLGGPPALLFSAIAPLPENVPELIFASLILGEKLSYSKVDHHKHPILSECEFAILGSAPPFERKEEGPFGDHYGYYGKKHPFPVFNLDTIYHRKDAIMPATCVGKPVQEDLFIGNYLQTLFSPLIRMTMPSVKELWSHGETGFHPLVTARVSERYEKESLGACFRILGEGQLSLTKCLFVTDANVDVKNFKQVLETILERVRFESDLYIFCNTSNDTLDYTGPKLNHGSKMIMLGLGKAKRNLLRHFSGKVPSNYSSPHVFCGGCLVIQGPNFKEGDDLSDIAKHPDFKDFPLVFVVDDAKSAVSSPLEFLWTVFTRFDPASDIYAKEIKLRGHHVSYSMPLVIDARMKPNYPEEALCDEETKALVDRRWNLYDIDAR